MKLIFGLLRESLCVAAIDIKLTFVETEYNRKKKTKARQTIIPTGDFINHLSVGVYDLCFVT